MYVSSTAALMYVSWISTSNVALNKFFCPVDVAADFSTEPNMRWFPNSLTGVSLKNLQSLLLRISHVVDKGYLATQEESGNLGSDHEHYSGVDFGSEPSLQNGPPFFVHRQKVGNVSVAPRADYFSFATWPWETSSSRVGQHATRFFKDRSHFTRAMVARSMGRIPETK